MSWNKTFTSQVGAISLKGDTIQLKLTVTQIVENNQETSITLTLTPAKVSEVVSHLEAYLREAGLKVTR